MLKEEKNHKKTKYKMYKQKSKVKIKGGKIWITMIL